MDRCRKCNALLLVGDNWTAGAARHKRYLCRLCAAAESSAWRISNPEKARASGRAWAKGNPERARERLRAWKKANPEKARASVDAWRKANPEKVRAGARHRNAARRARELAATVGDFDALREFEAGRWYAEEFIIGPVHLDHVQALAAGGAHAVGNLRWLPAWVNVRKGAKADHEVSDANARAWLTGPPTFEQVSYVTCRSPP